MSTGHNSTTVRDSNRLAVLERIRLAAPVSRAEIAKGTGLTPAAVTNIVSYLISEGLVVETGRRAQERGQPPVELDLAADGAYSVGLHLDRDLLSGVVADLKGNDLATLHVDLEPPTPERAMRHLARAYAELMEMARVPEDKLLGIGVVTVGPLDLRTGTVRGPPNFPGWRDVPLQRILESELGLPVILENNATAAAIGEYWYGAGRGLANFLYLYIGLGVGGGLFVGERVYRGTGLNAGEIGHLLVRDSGRVVNLESLVSTLALQRDLGDSYRDLNAVTEAFGRKDPRLLAWLDRAAGFLAEAVASIDNLLDLDSVIVGGRHSPELLEYLVAEVSERSRGLVMPNRPRYAQVLAGRAGADTAALGAAVLPLYSAFTTPAHRRAATR